MSTLAFWIQQHVVHVTHHYSYDPCALNAILFPCCMSLSIQMQLCQCQRCWWSRNSSRPGHPRVCYFVFFHVHFGDQIGSFNVHFGARIESSAASWSSSSFVDSASSLSTFFGFNSFDIGNHHSCIIVRLTPTIVIYWFHLFDLRHFILIIVVEFVSASWLHREFSTWSTYFPDSSDHVPWWLWVNRFGHFWSSDNLIGILLYFMALAHLSESNAYPFVVLILYVCPLLL